MTMRQLLPAVAALALIAAAPAAGDQPIAELGRDTPVAAYGGWEAWSAFDASAATYTLTLRDPSGAVKAAPLAPSKTPWDIALGPDAHGAVVAVYGSCAANGCDVRRLNVATGSDQALRAVSSPGYDEATPAIWRSTVVFTRHIGTCDVPYVKDLRSSKPSRRLLKHKCLTTTPGYAAIRGSRIVISSIDYSQAEGHGVGGKTSELRLYSATKGGSKVIDRVAFGEETNLFGQVALDARFAYTVHYGAHPTDAFLRLPLAGGAPQEVPTLRKVTGAFAKPSANGSLYGEVQDAQCDGWGYRDVPCRLAYAPSSPWLKERTLTPQLTVDRSGPPLDGQPMTFTGLLTQSTAAGSAIAATAPLVGVTVELYHRTNVIPIEIFEPTGLRAVTDGAGRYTIVLPAADAHDDYTAVAATPGAPTWAGRERP